MSPRWTSWGFRLRGDAQLCRVQGQVRRDNVIMANRWSDELADMAVKVYMRDLFKKD